MLRACCYVANFAELRNVKVQLRRILLLRRWVNKDDYCRVTLDVITQGHSGYAPPIMKKKYPIILTQTEREQLKDLIAAGTAPARKLTHARILLKADQSPQGPAWVDEEVADAVEVSQPTVSRVRKQYFEEGMEAALNRRPPNREYHRKSEEHTSEL